VNAHLMGLLAALANIPTGPGCRSPSPKASPDIEDPCRSWVGCAEWGLCTLRDDVCVAGTDTDCHQSRVCGEYGTCRALHGVCRPASVEGRCDSLGTQKSNWCKDNGYCTVVDGICTLGATSVSACRTAPVEHAESPCEWGGMCQPHAGFCVPASDSQCAVSAGCQRSGTCRKSGDRCVATAAACQRSEACKEHGECTAAFGVCMATDVSCAATETCKKHGDGCRAERGRCKLEKATPFIYFQF